MLEKQLGNKSHDNLAGGSKLELERGSSVRTRELPLKPKIYLDKSLAIKDFDDESSKSEDFNRISENYGQKHNEQVHSAHFISLEDKVAFYLKNAKILIQHKDYKMALHILRQASNCDSKNQEILRLLAQCLDATSKLEEALIVYKNLVKYDYCLETVYGLANVYYKLGDDQQALEKYYEALFILTTESDLVFEIYKNMGNIFVRKGDFDAAEEYYNKAYTLNTLSDVLLVNLGTLEVQRSDYNKALYCFRKAVEINPMNDKAWVGLAMVHSQLSDTDLAWANIESALEVNPKNRTAVHLAANWGQRDCRLDKAIEALKNFLEKVEEDEDMSLILINFFCIKGSYDLASLEIERVLAWNPDHKEVYNLKKKLISIQKES